MQHDNRSQRRGTFDLLFIADENKITVARAGVGGVIRLAHIPAKVILRTRALHGALRVVLHGREPRQVLLSVIENTPYEKTVHPLFEAVDEYCTERRIPLVWLPDVKQMARAASVPPTDSRRDGRLTRHGLVSRARRGLARLARNTRHIRCSKEHKKNRDFRGL